MPRRPPRPCAHPGCARLCEGGRCELHRLPRGRSSTPGWAGVRGSAASRGYGAAWRELRRQVLARDPVCRECGRRVSVTVDHVTPKSLGGTDDPSNLRGLCGTCHKAKSSAEGHAARREADRVRRGGARRPPTKEPPPCPADPPSPSSSPS
jgi:5-methylcytosine-specific restriction protein A